MGSKSDIKQSINNIFFFTLNFIYSTRSIIINLAIKEIQFQIKRDCWGAERMGPGWAGRDGTWGDKFLLTEAANKWKNQIFSSSFFTSSPLLNFLASSLPPKTVLFCLVFLYHQQPSPWSPSLTASPRRPTLSPRLTIVSQINWFSSFLSFSFLFLLIFEIKLNILIYKKKRTKPGTFYQ